MTQVQLDRAVARATGESVDFIRAFGFSALRLPSAPHWTRKASRISARALQIYRRPTPRCDQVREAA